MTEEELLFAAIRANPDEDTPRLAYADWLDEHFGEQAPAPLSPKVGMGRLPAATGSERAEYIRLTCELARRVNDVHSPEEAVRAQELRSRVRKLYPSVKKAWEAPFRNGKPLDGRYRGFHFYRGLPNWVILNEDEPLKYGDAMLRLSPVVEFRTHLVCAARLTRLLAAAWLRWLPRLSILGIGSSAQQPPDLRQFADSPHIGSLGWLKMEGAWTLSPDGADRLARSGALANLRCLRLQCPEPGSAGFAQLFDGPTFQHLTELRLSHVPLVAGELAAIFGSASLSSLESFCVTHSGMRRVEGEALARSPMWRNLRCLTLEGTTVNQGRDSTPSAWLRECAAAIQSAPPGRLEYLDLGHCRLGDREAASLARWPIWGSLRALHLYWNPEITVGGWGELIRAMSAGRMQELDLTGSTADDRVAKWIADAPHLADLRTLKLLDTQLSDKGALALAESSYLGQIRSLMLRGCRVGDAARRKLKKRFGKAVSFRDTF